MKFFALAALLATVAAVNLRDDADVTDLFNDNSDEIETQKSIAAAEKIHGSKISGDIAGESTAEILTQKASV
tara:strand:+ start:80 stop:295 length:216 start_codon:yes stop_codon:yes gene_type:complete